MIKVPKKMLHVQPKIIKESLVVRMRSSITSLGDIIAEIHGKEKEINVEPHERVKVTLKSLAEATTTDQETEEDQNNQAELENFTQFVESDDFMTSYDMCMQSIETLKQQK
ncbi:OLC1v1008411C1 [Oldenlandia corymbosa var. corymbosa]|uniref:OLC1v1008411C1 n=1 Tax=Oldenlandia corymbosa var. corymbosa TaxID=529605 RepID=A0AAV1DPC8_OLDCO|nr:OLC1v1008411C1 [Oldenlandia corymbosa var. corymbosa]